MQCFGCELGRVAEHPYLSTGTDRPVDVLFIADNPSKEEDQLGEVLSGAIGDMIKEAIGTKFSYAFTYVVRCHADKLGKNHISSCLPFLFSAIERTTPKLIVTLGKTAVQAVVHAKVKMSNMIGVVYKDDKFGNVLILPTRDTLNTARGDFLKHILRIPELLNQLDKYNPQETDWVVADSYGVLKARLEDLRKAPFVAVDIETTGPLRPYTTAASILTIGFAGSKNKGFCVPWNHKEGVLEHKDAAIELLREFFLSYKNIVFHNSQFDVVWLEHKLFGGRETINIFGDTMLLAYAVNTSQSRKLTHLVHEYVGLVNLKSELEEFRTRHGIEDMRDIPLEILAKYNVEDCTSTWALYDALSKYAKNPLYQFVLIPAIRALLNMELRGIRVDHALNRKMNKELTEQQVMFEAEFRDAGISNPNSSADIAKVLTAGLDENFLTHTNSGQICFDKKAMDVIRKGTTDKGNLALIDKLNEYKTISKNLSTYISNYNTTRVHPMFKVLGARSGRLACIDPNIQNLPKRGGTELKKSLAKNIRRQLIAEPGHILLNLDYSQIELRILAHVSEDKFLIEAFNSGADIHTATASKIFHKDPKDVLEGERDKAKTINFGIVYGMGYGALAGQLKISEDEAKAFIAQYFKTFKQVTKWLEHIKEFGKEKGYVDNMFGRRRSFNLEGLDDYMLGTRLREMANHPIQSGAHDIMMIAMAAVDKELKECGIEPGLVGEIHDAVIIDVPYDKALDVAALVLDIMQNPPITLKVPLTVGAEAGFSYGDLKKIDLTKTLEEQGLVLKQASCGTEVANG